MLFVHIVWLRLFHVHRSSPFQCFRFKHHIAGTAEDFEPYARVSDEIKLLMMKIITKSKVIKEKKRRLNSTDNILGLKYLVMILYIRILIYFLY